MLPQRIPYPFVLCIVGIITLSCMWDNDTVEMERQRFPEIIELVSGKFLRHSPEFYYWKVKDRSLKIPQFPDSLSLFDDLAVAHSKLGNDSAAIALMLQKETLAPGLYETYANLGTFYIHDGQLEQGLTYIKKAIEINPDAHFGREVYQQYVVEYVLKKRKENSHLFPLTLPTGGSGVLPSPPLIPEEFLAPYSNNFYTFLMEKGAETKNDMLTKESLYQAIKGVSGMMKFGNANSPILLEVLGDLLLSANQMGTYEDERVGSAKHLAARAYLKAAYQMADEEARQAYYQKATEMLLTAHPSYHTSLNHLHEILRREIEEGQKFYEKIRENEILWIKNGQDPEQEFKAHYYQEPNLSKREKWAYDGVAKMRKSLQTAHERKRFGNAQIDSYQLAHTIIPDSTVTQSIDSLFLEKSMREVAAGRSQDLPNTSGPQVSNWLFALLSLGVVGFLLYRLRTKAST